MVRDPALTTALLRGAVLSITKITGDIPFWRKNWLLLELREKYGCRAIATEL
jgi:hypothetical protein